MLTRNTLLAGEEQTAHEAAAEACAYVVGNRAVLHREVPEVGTQVGRRLGGLLAGRPVTLGR